MVLPSKGPSGTLDQAYKNPSLKLTGEVELLEATPHAALRASEKGWRIQPSLLSLHLVLFSVEHAEPRFHQQGAANTYVALHFLALPASLGFTLPNRRPVIYEIQII